MPHLLAQPSTISLPNPASYSTPSFFPVAYVGLRRPPPCRLFSTASCGVGGKCGKSTIVCMANPRRVKMVAKQIRREISDMLLTDKVLQYAVLPEAALGADRYLSSLTTISDVEVSADLQVVKVYVSVFGDERGKEVALAGLKAKAKYVRSELGKRMKLRLTPEVRFLEDESLERGSRVIAILDKLKDENEKNGTIDEDDDREEFAGRRDDDVEWEGDDIDDEGIIYVK
ncbi:hypothetical protein SASPL_128944 [Salvia splendens]|uniref:Ribosome-binding factor A n=1 Tax=Salvia splendens TaxID=180675 RepID=A0A8X8XDF7_SALSN|nr:probable ribosome-binding factor A, chloroplastic [Salvia splendens]KAG6410872.1 hypothetical protein SASPL_128944 [Salvia splendens]